ncbi:MAG TPA: hypothetical protein VGZ22_15065 [Isosphaeraceae bacterium]|jgi:hypothetical protein|nr:hypothetical protein [Isosphaeraceae bacterium]
MNSLFDRVDATTASALVLRARDVRVEDVLSRLEGGEPPDAVVASLGIAPLDVIAAVAVAALGMEEQADGPPLVQTSPGRPKLGKALEEPALERLLPTTKRPVRLALAAGLLQIHDFWEASHEAAQAADDLNEGQFSAYWHGIAHRREPDAGNAGYWFRKVGRHALFGPLWQGAQPLLDAHGDRTLIARIDRGGSWDPFAMIALCTSARPGSPDESIARKLQRLEMILLLEANAQAAGL